QRITLLETKKHYQIEFLIDASGSMSDNTEELKQSIAVIMDQAKKQLKEGGQVSFGVRFYVDGRFERAKPIDSIVQLEARALDKNFKTETEVKQTEDSMHTTLGGDIEDHWDQSMRALYQEPWASEDADVEKVLFLLTDEGGRVGKLEYTQQDVENESKEKGVRFEIIWMSDTVIDPASDQTPKNKRMSFANAVEVLSYKPGWASKFGKYDRMMAATRLGATFSPRVIPLLAKASDETIEPDRDVRSAALKALGEIDDPKIFPVFARTLATQTDTTYTDRFKAIEVLRELNGPEVVELLMNAGDPDKEKEFGVREFATMGLFGRKDPRIVPHLGRLLTQSTKMTTGDRHDAIHVLGHLDGPEVVSILLNEIKETKNEGSRDNAIRALATKKDPRIVPYLAPLLERTHSTIAILYTLKEQKDSQATPYITDFLFAKRPHLPQKIRDEQLSAIEALDAIGDKTILPRLKQDIEKTYSSQTKVALLKVIAKLGDKGFASTALAKMIVPNMDVENKVQKEALEALEWIDAPETFDALVHIIDPQSGFSTHQRVGAMFGLGNLSDPRVVPYVIRMMSKENDDYYLHIELPPKKDGSFYVHDFRQAAVNILDKKRDPRSFDVLKRIYETSTKEKERDLHYKAGEALLHLNDLRAIPLFYDSQEGFIFLGDTWRDFIRAPNALAYATETIDPKKTKDPLAREAAASFMAGLSDPEIIPWLMEASDPRLEPNEKVRKKAAEVLKLKLVYFHSRKKFHFDIQKYLPYLYERLDATLEKNPEIRKTIVSTLQFSKDPSVVTLLDHVAATDPSPEVQSAATSVRDSLLIK
ncbi:MAG: HEAT repeat domain-containing protein, partial [Deltaproteobacteria bacterium]|nr:HEAT repeat domain-containing protein [Deltaproteobacteria bacterium]